MSHGAGTLGEGGDYICPIPPRKQPRPQVISLSWWTWGCFSSREDGQTAILGLFHPHDPFPSLITSVVHTPEGPPPRNPMDFRSLLRKLYLTSWAFDVHIIHHFGLYHLAPSTPCLAHSVALKFISSGLRLLGVQIQPVPHTSYPQSIPEP